MLSANLGQEDQVFFDFLLFFLPCFFTLPSLEHHCRTSLKPHNNLKMLVSFFKSILREMMQFVLTQNIEIDPNLKGLIDLCFLIYYGEDDFCLGFWEDVSIPPSFSVKE